jgi:simple sugar transport system permease protein
MLKHLKWTGRKLTQMEKYLLAIILVYSLVVTFINPAFFSAETLFDMLESSAGTMLLALGVLIVIISGGIDVSFTAIAIVAGYCAIKFMMLLGINNLFFVFLIAILLGAFLGLINALIIYYFKLPTLIVTLGTSSVFFGLMTTFVGTKSIPLSNIPSSIIDFGSTSIIRITQADNSFGLSVFIIFVIAMIILVWFILYRTMLGRSIFAIGNSQESASRVGINILTTQIFIYCFMGALSGIMSIIYFAKLKFVNPVSLVGSEMMVIAAVVIGGAKLTGGEGTIFGTVLGVSLITLFSSTLIFIGLSTAWNNFFVGTILILSIAIISYQARIKNRENLIFTD